MLNKNALHDDTAHFFRDIALGSELILRAAGEGIYGVNTHGKTTFVNPAAERMLGWTADELIGRDMHSAVHHTHADGSHYPDEQCPIYAAFRDGAVHTVDNEVFWRKNGTPFFVEYTSTPIHDGERLVGAVIVFRDVTLRREAEAKLQAARAEVDRLRKKLELENAYLREEIRGATSAHGIVGASTAIQTILRQIELVAPTDASVLVTGEPGTGKELIARAIHEASQRNGRPFIRVNCAATPRESFESELFGHVKGALPGAVRDRAGRFELADHGTLFIDEIAEIPVELQGKILRVLQDGTIERVGDGRGRSVSVRLIAATTRNLKSEIRRGRFREDLYFRLNVFPIETTPLRERPDDIGPLALHFLDTAMRKLKTGGLMLTEGDVRRLMQYDWPGNVRELQNVIERGAILARGGRARLDVPGDGTSPRRSLQTRQAILNEDERRARDRANIVAALQTCGGKVFGPGGAAELLDLKATTLASRMKALGIPSPRAMADARR